MNIKKTLIISISVLLVGLILIAVGSISGGLSYVKNTNLDNISISLGSSVDLLKEGEYFKSDLDDFSKINVNFDNVNLKIEETENSVAYIESENYNKNEFKYEISDGELIITQKSKDFVLKKGKNSLFEINSLKNLMFGKIGSKNTFYTLSLFLPNKQFEKIRVDNSAGYIYIDDLDVKELEIKLDFGEIEFDDINVENAEIKSNMGRTELNNFNSAKKIVIESDMGEITIDDSKFSDLILDSNMGNVEFENLFVDKSLSISCDMGNVEGELNYDYSKKYLVNIDGGLSNVDVDDKFYEYSSNTKGNVEINLDCDMGNIELNSK